MNSLFFVSSPYSETEDPSSSEIYRSIAIQSSSETIALAILNAVSTPFVQASQRYIIPVVSAGVAIINTGFRFINKAWIKDTDKDMNPYLSNGTLRSLCLHVQCLFFSLIDIPTLKVLIHELGHFIAMKILFKNNHPVINDIPFIGGNTLFNGNIADLSEIGTQLGQKNAWLVTVAAGPALIQLVSTIQLIASQFLIPKYPKIGYYVFWSGLVGVFGTATYALTAAFTSKLNSPIPNDFTVLHQNLGLHPAAMAAGSLAIPLILMGATWSIKKIYLIHRSKSEPKP